MEPKEKKQPLTRADVRHQRKALKKSTKPERIAMKKAEGEKLHNKMSQKPKVKDQKSKRPIQQARLTNH